VQIIAVRHKGHDAEFGDKNERKTSEMKIQRLTDKALQVMARRVFEVETVDDAEAERRLAICRNCPTNDFEPEREKCKVCGCFMVEKTRMAVHRTLRRPQGEVTHCPKAHWDKEAEEKLIELYNNTNH
jgi:hypothetical protein